MNAENNKLMTEFLGYKLVPCNNGMAWERPTLSSIHDTFKLHGRLWRESDKSYYQYHSDWNWLMPVVEKIRGVRSYDRGDIFPTVVILSNSIVQIYSEKYGNKKIHDKTSFSRAFGGNSSIENTYRACLEFIKWYNQTQS